MCKDLAPAGVLEGSLVEDLINIIWRKRRVIAHESALIGQKAANAQRDWEQRNQVSVDLERLLSSLRRSEPEIPDFKELGIDFDSPGETAHQLLQGIRAWLELHGERSLVIVDPHCCRIPDPFLHLTPQVEIIIEKSATDYLDEYGAISRSRSDSLSRILRAWTREDPLSRKESWARFFGSEVDQTIHGLAEWSSTLPMRDGDLDLEAMGLTLEEFIELGKKTVQFPTVDELLFRFLTETNALPDSMKEPE